MIFNIFDPELYTKPMINTKPKFKKVKELLSELKKVQFRAILVLDYKKSNDHKIFHSSKN